MLQINPNDALAYYNRATAKAQLGNQQDAIADFQKAADLGKQQDNQRLYQDALDKIKDLQQSVAERQTV